MTPRQLILELARERFAQLNQKEQEKFKLLSKELLNNERAYFRLIQLLEGFWDQGPKEKGLRT